MYVSAGTLDQSLVTKRKGGRQATRISTAVLPFNIPYLRLMDDYDDCNCQRLLYQEQALF